MTITDTAPAAPGGSLSQALLSRQLPHYPERARRYWFLGLVTITTIILYYVYFVPGGVLPLLLPYYHMSFLYFMTLIVIANAGGAATAYIGGLSDRIGRGNLTVGGLLVIGALQAFAIPAAHTKATFDIAYVAIGFVEGVILVVTPALVRDFSPQMGRGTAMGFWALGPVLGALTVTRVATETINHLHPWQDQFMISGFVCLAMFVIAFFFLRELAPSIRDQMMKSAKDRALIEARAKGIDVDAALVHPLRSMFKVDLISSAFGISVFLLLYYAAVTILALYWVIVFYSHLPTSLATSNANGINSWFFLADAIGLVAMGFLSDRLRVRKPFMLVGTALYIVLTIVFLTRAHHPTTGYYSLAWLMAALGFASAIPYSPWMASYTENVEDKNPALSATGLAVWGNILRVVVAASFLVIPHVISSASTIVDNQQVVPTLQAFQTAAKYAPNTTTLSCNQTPAPQPVINALNASRRPGPHALAQILAGCNQTHNLLTAVQMAGGLANPQVTALQKYTPLALGIQAGQPVSAQQIQSEVGVHSPDLANLLLVEQKIVPAQKDSANQWQHWWWVCVLGQAIFLLLVLTMKGPWSPAKAKATFDSYEAKVAEEIAKLGLGSSGS